MSGDGGGGGGGGAGRRCLVELLSAASCVSLWLVWFGFSVSGFPVHCNVSIYQRRMDSYYYYCSFMERLQPKETHILWKNIHLIAEQEAFHDIRLKSTYRETANNGDRSERHQRSESERHQRSEGRAA